MQSSEIRKKNWKYILENYELSPKFSELFGEIRVRTYPRNMYISLESDLGEIESFVRSFGGTRIEVI